MPWVNTRLCTWSRQKRFGFYDLQVLWPERERWDSPNQVGKKHLCQPVGQPGEESFKLGAMLEEDDNLQSDGEVVDLPGKETFFTWLKISTQS